MSHPGTSSCDDAPTLIALDDHLCIEVATNESELEKRVTEWDLLAVQCERPFCAPRWLIVWWRHAAPENAQLRVIFVFDDSGLIGVGPFFLDKTRAGLRRCRLLGAGTSHRLEPLALPGLDSLVAKAIVASLERIDPKPHLLLLEAITLDSGWCELALRKESVGCGRIATALFPPPCTKSMAQATRNGSRRAAATSASRHDVRDDNWRSEV
jgi:hypothetical protein